MKHIIYNNGAPPQTRIRYNAKRVSPLMTPSAGAKPQVQPALAPGSDSVLLVDLTPAMQHRPSDPPIPSRCHDIHPSHKKILRRPPTARGGLLILAGVAELGMGGTRARLEELSHCLRRYAHHTHLYLFSPARPRMWYFHPSRARITGPPLRARKAGVFDREVKLPVMTQR